MARKSIPALLRFLAKIDHNGPQPSSFRHRGVCWQWTAGKTRQGYGGFHPVKGQTVLAHRYSYNHYVGPIPEGLVIDHLCRNRACVNPSHLEAVTMGTNTMRSPGVSFFNKLKTSCPAGHPYDAANTYKSPRGSRICRECARERDRQPHRHISVRRAKKAAMNNGNR